MYELFGSCYISATCSLIFVFCNAHLILFYLAGSLYPPAKPSVTIFKITFWLGYFNSCINPVIYPCSSREFRKAFQNILHGRCSHRKQASSKYSSGFILSSPVHRSPDEHRDVVRIPVGSGETFYKITKSDGMCEWKYFSPVPSPSSPYGAPKDFTNCSTARVSSKSILRTCCCIGTQPPRTHYNVPTIKIHTISVSENGEPV